MISPAAADPGPRRYDMLQAGLDLLDQGFTVFDAELKLVAWNDTFLRLLDFPRGMAFVGADFESFIRYNAERGEYGPGDPEAQVAERVEAARGFRSHVTERVRPGGRVLLVRGEPLPHSGFVTLYSDITEERYIRDLLQHQHEDLEERVRRRTAQLEDANARLTRAVAEQKRMQAALVQAQKMEAIGQLTGGLAHDFNNLLTVVIGNLAAFQDQRPDDPATADFVAPALESARRGVQLIRRLLTFSRQQPLDPRVVEGCGLVCSLVTLIRRSLPESIAIALDLPPAPLHMRVDPAQFEAALLNFALNARDAMADGGRLSIALAPRVVATEDTEFAVPPGDYVLLEVADDGAGMDAATLARVFEPFFTTKRPGLGSGLGLSMVQEFVQQSGGGIRIASSPGQGTRVRLLLPAAQPEEGADDHGAVGGGDHAGELVLLVEDEPGVRRVVRQQLLSLGYPVIEADDGAQALEMIAQVPDIAIVLSDLVMPGGIDGRTLARRIREAGTAARVVLMSGYAEGEDGGEPAVLAKPFTLGQLARALAGREETA